MRTKIGQLKKKKAFVILQITTKLTWNKYQIILGLGKQIFFWLQKINFLFLGGGRETLQWFLFLSCACEWSNTLIFERLRCKISWFQISQDFLHTWGHNIEKMILHIHTRACLGEIMNYHYGNTSIKQRNTNEKNCSLTLTSRKLRPIFSLNFKSLFYPKPNPFCLFMLCKKHSRSKIWTSWQNWIVLGTHNYE